ncbi:SDR family oxidoreductase [Actinocorallia sp. A-T 12471]|uniref:SDR family oxidoreductase n=1 Tax=Actinocorallia sp. A-T 12471 TaxID=3089813 RepID=UPI0029D256D4|nr:SDR family oxidoreductase [Actinocorallia sp. A-T 12471]MDX6741494.1 SDR family oxidoreductase [Actinocorallia sp. A-T 12471]
MDPAEPRDSPRTAVVTGGSGGIGLACAEVLMARGYEVVLTARTAKPLRAAAERIGARWVAADAADPVGFAGVVAAVGRVDLLVHAAGTLAGTFVRKERVEDFDAVLRANLRSTLVAVQGVLPKMRQGGRIVLISSSSSEQGMKGRAAYSASKAGMNAFAESLAAELERDGINVNLVIPAPVETPMLQDVSFEMHALQPEDVAGVVGFLDSLDPRVVLPRISMRAAAEGPLASRTVIPPKVRA